LNDHRSRDPLEVPANVLEPQRWSCSDERSHIIFLTVTEFHQKPAVAPQPLRGGLDDPFDVPQAVSPAEECDLGFVPDAA
jgi:hypothetical protein